MNSTARSELSKAATNPLVIVGVVASSIAVPVLALLVRRSGGATDASFVDAVGVAAQFGQAFAVMIGGGLLGEEFESDQLRTTLLATPNRARAFAAKAAVVTVLTLGAFAVGMLAAQVLQIGVDAAPDWVVSPARFLAMASSWMLLSLLAFALAGAARSQIVPIAIMVPLLLGGSQLLRALTGMAGYLPDLARMNTFLPNRSSEFLSPVNGLWVQVVWVVCLGAVAFASFTTRDVGG